MQKRGKRREEKKKSDMKKYWDLVGIDPCQDLNLKERGKKKEDENYNKSLHRIEPNAVVPHVM